MNDLHTVDWLTHVSRVGISIIKVGFGMALDFDLVKNLLITYTHISTIIALVPTEL